MAFKVFDIVEGWAIDNKSNMKSLFVGYIGRYFAKYGLDLDMVKKLIIACDKYPNLLEIIKLKIETDCPEYKSLINTAISLS